jgi:GNAT superfamily N-acetyltransferase
MPRALFDLSIDNSINFSVRTCAQPPAKAQTNGTASAPAPAPAAAAAASASADAKSPAAAADAAVVRGEWVGFARVVTDFGSFAYLADVYVEPAHRKGGVANWLVGLIKSYPLFQPLRRFMLVTADAQALYERNGWTRIDPNKTTAMSITRPYIVPKPQADTAAGAGAAGTAASAAAQPNGSGGGAPSS